MLKGPLPLSDALRVAGQIANAIFKPPTGARR
jgi:hypothetical protein